MALNSWTIFSLKKDVLNRWLKKPGLFGFLLNIFLESKDLKDANKDFGKSEKGIRSLFPNKIPFGYEL